MTGFRGLADTDRIVVSGGSGWMGRELLRRLSLSHPTVATLLLGQHERAIEVNGRRYHVERWEPARVRSWSPTVFVHLAFTTREHLDTMPASRYQWEHADLLRKAQDLICTADLRAFVYASSGASLRPATDLYAKLKATDEELFRGIADARGLPAVIGRIWAVSGIECTKPTCFAFFDVLRQAAQEPVIHLKANHEVWRSYADAGEFLEACIAGACLGYSGTMNSWGKAVELQTIAETALEILSITKDVTREPLIAPPDIYCPDSDASSFFASLLGIQVADLRRQIGRCLTLFSPTLRLQSL